MNILIKNIKMLINGGTPKGDICISGNKILSAGVIPEGFAADKVIDGSDKLAIPGLINCHTHTYMSLFRNLADDLSFEDWLFGAIMPREDALSPEDAYWGAMLSCAEMIKTGTTCFMDMHMFPAMTASAADKLGMRAVMTRGLTGSDRNDKDGIRRYNEHMDERERFKGNDRITFKLGPHAIYTCGEDYLRWLIEKAHETEQEFHIHLSETTTEVQNCYMGTDSQASNNDLNLFSDMNFAALLHKGATGCPTVCTAKEVLDFATVNGAKALGIPDIGSIEAGKKADIAILDLDRPQFCPRNDLSSALVYSANGSEVDTVIIDGEVVLEHGRLTKFDEEEIYAHAKAVAEKF